MQSYVGVEVISFSGIGNPGDFKGKSCVFRRSVTDRAFTGVDVSRFYSADSDDMWIPFTQMKTARETQTRWWQRWRAGARTYIKKTARVAKNERFAANMEN